MCHTLVPNVTVNFERIRGNFISLRWHKYFRENIPEWRIYIHDKYEHVVLASYAMSDLPYITLKSATVGEPSTYKSKAKLQPRLTKKPNTRVHKCNEDPSYSQNLCYLKLFWNLRVDTLKKYYGSRLDCLIPGLLVNHDFPICTKSTAGAPNLWNKTNETIGYLDLTNIEGMYGISIVSSKK